MSERAPNLPPPSPEEAIAVGWLRSRKRVRVKGRTDEGGEVVSVYYNARNVLCCRLRNGSGLEDAWKFERLELDD